MDREQAKSTISNIADRAKEAAGNAVDADRAQAEGMVDQAAGATQQAYGAAKETARQAVDTGHAYYDDGVRALTRRVEGSPLNSLVIAGLAGLVVGWLCRGSDTRNDYRSRNR